MSCFRMLPALFLTALLVALLSSCSTTRSLGEDQYLYKETVISSPEEEEKLPGDLKSSLESAVVHQTNKRILGILPLRLWIYHLPGDVEKEKGLGHWIRTKLGEPPEVFLSYEVEATVDQMQNVLVNHGYFDYSIRPERLTEDKKLSMLYQVSLEEPYLISGVTWPRATDSLTRYMRDLAAGSVLKSGQQFSLEKLGEERERLMDHLKSSGFFFLLEDHIYFSLDTAIKGHQVQVSVALSEDIDPAARRIQHIRDIYFRHLHQDAPEASLSDTVAVDSIFHTYKEDLIMDPEMLNNSLVYRLGERYREEDYQKTLRKLNALGIFQFISLNYKEQEEPGQLDAVIELVPSLPQSFRAELQMVTRSTDYTGPVLRLTYQNQNFNEKAATFRTSLNTGYAVQMGADRRGYHALDAGVNLELDIPRLLVPGIGYEWFRNKATTPLTRIRAGYTYFLRTRLFEAHSIDGSFGYRWNPSTTLSHELSLVSVDYTSIRELGNGLGEDDRGRLRLQDELINFLRYEFTMNNLAKKRSVNLYTSSSIETAGNLPYLLRGGMGDGSDPGNGDPGNGDPGNGDPGNGDPGNGDPGNGDPGDPGTIFGVPYFNYLRIGEDFRIYYHPAEDHNLVSRLFAGVGIPYGHSDQLPFRKQFFVGGVSSLRAFRVRSLGPGSYDPDTVTAISYLDRMGDIRLEANLEYRFPVVSVVNGAVFADAGNVWLYNPNPELPGAHFTFPQFMSQVAVGTGLGIRLNLTILVLRLDLAIPVRKPYLPEGERWVFDQIDFTDPSWRKGNLVFNLAIGYPF